MQGGWVKIHREMLLWQWYQDIPTKVVFLHLLLSANFEDKNWQRITIKRGQLVTSRGSLAESLNLSEMQVRRALHNLIYSQEITIETTSKYSLITVVKYEEYQIKQPAKNKQKTNKQPQHKNSSDNKLSSLEEWLGSRELIPMNLIEWAMAEKGWKEEIALDTWKAFLEWFTDGKGKNEQRGDWALSWKRWARKENINGENNGKRESEHEKLKKVFAQFAPR